MIGSVSLLTELDIVSLPDQVGMRQIGVLISERKLNSDLLGEKMRIYNRVLEGIKAAPRGPLEIFAVLLWTFSISYASFVLNGRLIGIDDADIFFTYASNLADGLGITYSVGIPPVEGYTSALWMLLAALMFYLGFAEIGIFVLTIMLFFMTHLLAFRIIEKMVAATFWAFAKFLYILMISLSFGYISWMTATLMDTTIWGFLLMSLFYVTVSPPKNRVFRILSGGVFILIPLARPESFFVVPAIFLVLVFLGRNLITRSLVVNLLLFCASALAITVARLSIFGYPFPNTVYAKVSPSLIYNLEQGFTYFALYSSSTAPAILAFILAFGWLGYSISKRISASNTLVPGNPLLQKSRAEVVLSTFVLVLAVAPILSGGDHFNLFRLYQPSYPLAILLVVLSWSKWRRFSVDMKPQIVSLGTLSLFLVASMLASSPNSWVGVQSAGRSPIAHEFEISRWNRIEGDRLQNMFSELDQKPALGVIAAGGIARTYSGPIYDLMGLNNSQIAHFPGDRQGVKNHAAFSSEVFYQLPVDILLAHPSQEEDFVFVVLKGVMHQERFVNTFVYGCASNLVDATVEVCGFFRETFASSIRAKNQFTFVERLTFDKETGIWE